MERSTTTKELELLLEQRYQEPERAGEIDRRIWEQMGVHAAVLVCDLSGFTRTTKARGVVHFLMLYQQVIRICRPEVESVGGEIAFAKADNITALFPGVQEGIQAAVGMNSVMHAYNKGASQDSQLHLCIGISSGKIIRTDSDVHGDPVNVAHKLGEDIAGPDEILVSDEAYSALGDPGSFRFHPRQEVSISAVTLGYRRLAF